MTWPVQSAIEADSARCKPRSRRIYLSPDVTSRSTTRDANNARHGATGEALAILRYLFGGEDHIDARIATSAGDRTAEARWRLIGKRITLLREAAVKDDLSVSGRAHRRLNRMRLAIERLAA